MRDVCWWKKKHQVFVWTNDVVDFWCSVPKQSICFHENKVFLMYSAKTKYFMCTVPKQSIPAWRQIDSASLCVCGSQTLQKGIIWLQLKLAQVLFTIGQILSTKIFIYNVASCNVLPIPKNNKCYWLYYWSIKLNVYCSNQGLIVFLFISFVFVCVRAANSGSIRESAGALRPMRRKCCVLVDKGNKHKYKT